MNWKKIKDNSVKIGIMAINLLLAAGGVYYFKNKDQQRKETQLQETENYNKEVARYETDLIQSALKESVLEKEKSISANSGEITKQETVTVKKIIPAVTEQVKVPKPSKSTSSS